MKSLYTGITGVKANQTKLDVIGNNVANVGTTAFKKSTLRFSDTLYQTNSFTTGPSERYGGANSHQVGLGVSVSGIVRHGLQGSLQATGRKTDLAMDGDGFFVVASGSGTPDDPYELSYTRDGSFSLDKNNNLVTLDGYRVMGKDIDPVTGLPTGDLKPITIPSSVEITKNGAKEDHKVVDYTFSSDGNGVLTLILDDGTKINQTMIEVAVFTNTEGLSAIGSNRFQPSPNTSDPIFMSVEGDSALYGKVTQGYIEMSNVDLSEEFTEMIVTTRSFQSASKIITTSDELLQEIINLKR